ncbi:MAG: PAS domain S-box protein [Candidatus Cyclobacteriaceae bacterium M2_1C_046]
MKKILFIEDYEDDYSLLLRQIKKAGYEIEAKRVMDRINLIQALKEPWDAIICDNKLPGLNAFDALQLVRDINPDLPFIIVSGFLTDKEARRAMDSGASDYIIKGDYNRFIPALGRELRDYKIKQEKKLIEKQLIKKEEAFNLLTENAQDLLLLADVKGKLLYVSSSVEKIAGYKVNDVLGRNINDFLPPDNQEKFQMILDEINKGILRTFKATYDVIKSDGSIVVLENIIKPFCNEEGNIILVSTSRDITEIIKYRKEISKTEKRFTVAAQELQQLLHYANAPIFGINWNGEINEWNPRAEKVIGYKREEVIGKKFFNNIIPKPHQMPLVRIFKNALTDKKATNYEVPVITKNGDQRIMLLSATPRRNFDGEIIGVICYAQDITDQIEYRERLEKKVEERTKQLEDALKKEKELAALKSRFVSMASHEFKTPISTISFAADYIERYFEKAPKEKIIERLHKIKEQVNNMVYLLNDVLTIGKSEEGKIKINAKEIDLSDFISKLLEDVEMCNNSHKICVENDFPEDLKITTDPVLLSNICTNLLENGIKYSPEKNQIIWKAKSQGNKIVFTVQDFGVGIPLEDQDKVFEPFHRASNTQSFEGTGLGLSIVKRAAETLGGNVKLISSSSEGSVFEFTLPLVK